MKSFFPFLLLIVALAAGAEDRTVSLQKRTAAVGGVTVSVTPVALASAGSERIDFQIVMDTHSGALPSDMLSVARLLWGRGTAIAPVSWSGARGGHHLSGRLSFHAAGSEAAMDFSLLLRSLDGKNDLRFEWRLPSSVAGTSPGGT